MGRPRLYESPAARKAAHRNRQRIAAGKPAVLSAAEQRAADRLTDAANVADIRAMLIRRGRADLAEKMYPQGHRAPAARCRCRKCNIYSHAEGEWGRSVRALSKQHIPQFVLPEYGMDESERLTWSEAYSILAKLTEAGVAVPPRPVPDVVVELYDADVEDDGRGWLKKMGL
jgi:hypothetical protein